MRTIQEALNYGDKELSREGIMNHLLEIRILLRDSLEITEEKMITDTKVTISEEQFHKYKRFIMRRKDREPIAYIIKKKEFWKNLFFINQSTLIPRPDSETIIESILKYIPNKHSELNFIDLGMGSGCLIISTLQEYVLSRGLGIDDSPEAIKVAKKNKDLLINKYRLDYALGDFSNFDTSNFDVVICNPPYINDKEKENLGRDIINYEPHRALFAAENGTGFYKSIIKNLNNNFRKDQMVFFEIGFDQSKFVCNLLKNNNFTVLGIESDICEKPRCIVAKRK